KVSVAVCAAAGAASASRTMTAAGETFISRQLQREALGPIIGRIAAGCRVLSKFCPLPLARGRCGVVDGAEVIPEARIRLGDACRVFDADAVGHGPEHGKTHGHPVVGITAN